MHACVALSFTLLNEAAFPRCRGTSGYIYLHEYILMRIITHKQVFVMHVGLLAEMPSYIKMQYHLVCASSVCMVYFSFQYIYLFIYLINVCVCVFIYVLTSMNSAQRQQNKQPISSLKITNGRETCEAWSTHLLCGSDVFQNQTALSRWSRTTLALISDHIAIHSSVTEQPLCLQKVQVRWMERRAMGAPATGIQRGVSSAGCYGWALKLELAQVARSLELKLSKMYLTMCVYAAVNLSNPNI